MLKKYLYSLLLLCLSFNIHAQSSFVGGYLKAELIGDVLESLTIRVTATVYSTSNDPEQTISVFWGDGLSEEVELTSGIALGEDGLYILQFWAHHTYPARNTYGIAAQTCCLNEDIINISNPASTPFLLYLEYDFPNPQFQGSNGTPSLLQPLSDIAIIGQDYTFNSNAYDPDGDSLAYEIEPSFLEPYGYIAPNELDTGGENIFVVDPITGDLSWNYPEIESRKYIIPYLITAYRDGLPVSKTFALLQLEIMGTNPTTLNELEEGPELYPNPISRGWVMVKWPDNEGYEYVLYNSVGERLLQGNATSQFLPLNISYPNGMYWLKVNNEKKSWSLPLIIQ
jgi:hypothetical protein